MSNQVTKVNHLKMNPENNPEEEKSSVEKQACRGEREGRPAWGKHSREHDTERGGCWGDGAGALTPSQSVRNACTLQSRTETLIVQSIKSSFHSF